MRDLLVALAIVVVTASAATSSAALLGVFAGTIQAFAGTGPALETVAATVWISGHQGDTDDDGGSDFSAVVFLPAGLSVSDIDPATVRMCKGTSVCGPDSIAPLDTSVRQDSLRARFSRAQALAMIGPVPTNTIVDLAVSGSVIPPNVIFVGSDDVLVPGN